MCNHTGENFGRTLRRSEIMVVSLRAMCPKVGNKRVKKVQTLDDIYIYIYIPSYTYIYI